MPWVNQTKRVVLIMFYSGLNHTRNVVQDSLLNKKLITPWDCILMQLLLQFYSKSIDQVA